MWVCLIIVYMCISVCVRACEWVSECVCVCESM